MCVEFGLQKNFIYFFRIGYDPLRYQRDYGNESEDKTKMQMTQSINQYSENQTKIWHQNILN